MNILHIDMFDVFPTYLFVLNIIVILMDVIRNDESSVFSIK